MTNKFAIIRVINLVCAFILYACADAPAPNKLVELTGLTVSPTSLSLVLGGATSSQQITATATPEDATDVTITWSSGNSNIASVSQGGLVTAQVAGNTAITVTANTANELIRRTVQVTVENDGPPAPFISFLNKNTGVFGDEVIITGTGFSSTVTDNEVYFTSVGTAVEAEITEASATSLKVIAPYLYRSDVTVHVITNAVQSNHARFTFDLFHSDSVAIANGTWASEQLRADITWRNITFYAFDQLDYRRVVNVIEITPGAEGISTHLGIAVKADGGTQTTSELGASVGALAAINGGYFIWNDTDRQWYSATGQNSLDHVRINNQVAVMGRARPTNEWPTIPPWVDVCVAFSNMPDKTADMAFHHLNITNDRNTVQSHDFAAGINPVRAAGGYHYALTVGPWLVSNGAIRDNIGPSEPTRPRAGIGKNSTTGKVYFVIVDGDDAPNATGITQAQLAIILKALGCTDAMNLDGGGSSTMWIQGKGKVSYINNSSTFERPVANIIYVK